MEIVTGEFKNYEVKLDRNKKEFLIVEVGDKKGAMFFNFSAVSIDEVKTHQGKQVQATYKVEDSEGKDGKIYPRTTFSEIMPIARDISQDRGEPARQPDPPVEAYDQAPSASPAPGRTNGSKTTQASIIMQCIYKVAGPMATHAVKQKELQFKTAADADTHLQMLEYYASGAVESLLKQTEILAKRL
ncbi:MAG: hypothetical protein GY853_13635 [PVC group bacterium]|nr:hypothetical protein [PVC group bacterium]